VKELRGMKIGSLVLRIAIFGVISGSVLSGCRYFPESTFELANESRLPSWVVLPPEVTRSNVSITMSYYSKLWGDDVLFTIHGGGAPTEVSGKEKCRGPIHLKSPAGESSSDYPRYQLVTVNGVNEVIEHRKMEPVFYISDDPEVRKAVLAACD
jgi:hypothetical protein